MNALDLDDLDPDWAFTNIPLLESFDKGDFTITSLPGYTNRNFRLCGKDHDWVLRLPRAHTDRFIDRATEAHNQQLACQLGLAPGVAWRNTAGVSLTPTLKSTRSLAAADFTRDDSLRTIVEPLIKLHHSGLQFRGRENLGELLFSHYDLLKEPCRQQFSARMKQAQRVLSLLDTSEQLWVPSHRDLVLENQLLEGNRLWYIDWEYSAMASAYWDLATLCNEAELDLYQSRRLLQAYCAGGTAMKESTLFDYRGLLKLFSDCWMSALAQ